MATRGVCLRVLRRQSAQSGVRVYADLAKSTHVGIRWSSEAISTAGWSRLTQAVFFFFFQAEDGIRDLTVTGVQTCALPILDAHEAHGGAAGFARAAGEGRDGATCRRSARQEILGAVAPGVRESLKARGGGAWVGASSARSRRARFRRRS